MKFAAQFMQFMVLIPAAILCFLPMKDQLTSPPKKIIARIWLVLTILIPVSALIFMAGNFPANYVMLPDIAILYLSCSDLCTICHQRRICPALLSHL